MRQCENQWLNLPEGSRIGPRMAAIWRTNFSGYGTPPSHEEEAIVRFWDEAELRKMRRDVIAEYEKSTTGAPRFVHPRILKQNTNKPGTGGPGISTVVNESLPDVFVTVTFYHPKFRWTPPSTPGGTEPWQIQCSEP